MSLRKLKRAGTRASIKKKTDPVAAEKYFRRGIDHKQSGRLNEAESCFRRAVKMDPEHGRAWNNLGNILHDQGKTEDALPCYKKSCELMATTPVCWYNLGTCLHESGLPGEAARALKQAVQLAPDYVEAYTSLGIARQAAGDIDGAIAALQDANRIQPDNGETHRNLGLALKDSGRMTEALTEFKLALRLNPDDACTWYNRVRYRKYLSPQDGDIRRMELLLQKSDFSAEDAIFLHFGLGKIYDDLKIHQKAYSHYRRGNRLKRDSLRSGLISTGIELGKIRQTFQPELFSRLSSAGTPSELPVFIVGMPRSGTSLVEQICASHSRVHGRGELKNISALKDKITELTGGRRPYPECLGSAKPHLLRSLGQEYITDLANTPAGGITRVTDKMPANFILLGLIRILFPGVRIIHCTREPLDCCLSNFFQLFNEGNECSYELETLALYYRKYSALMDFWKQILPGKIHEVRYEALVSDPEENSRRLIAFLGLQWEENCLSFHNTKRTVQTASDWQVRQPIYKTSVQRWKNYEPYIGELMEGLASTSRLV